MEQSLTVPIATSSRTIPVKLLEENRRIINEHLAAQGRGKVSFTHIIGWAIVKALKEYPHLNFAYGDVDGAPSRPSGYIIAPDMRSTAPLVPYTYTYWPPNGRPRG